MMLDCGGRRGGMMLEEVMGDGGREEARGEISWVMFDWKVA